MMRFWFKSIQNSNFCFNSYFMGFSLGLTIRLNHIKFYKLKYINFKLKIKKNKSHINFVIHEQVSKFNIKLLMFKSLVKNPINVTYWIHLYISFI